MPPIVVSPAATKPKPGIARATPRTLRPTRPILTQRVQARPAPSPALYPTTPLPGSGIDPEKVPASVNIVDVKQIEQTHSANIAVALQQYVPGIVVNEVSGNPVQMKNGFNLHGTESQRCPKGDIARCGAHRDLGIFSLAR